MYMNNIGYPNIDNLEVLHKKLQMFLKEEQLLYIRRKNIEFDNKKIFEQIAYYNDKLYFKNVRYSSAANFIALNPSPIKIIVDFYIDKYNNNEKEIDMIKKRTNVVDFALYKINFAIQNYN